MNHQDLLTEAWKLLESEMSDQAKLDALLPLISDIAESGDWEARTILALAYLHHGDIQNCDFWTSSAELSGARDFWIAQQQQFQDFAALVARSDALLSLQTEELNLIDASTAFQYHIFQNLSNESFYFGVKTVRHIWEKVDSDTRIQYISGLIRTNLENLNESNNQLLVVCLSSALSFIVAEEILFQVALDSNIVP